VTIGRSKTSQRDQVLGDAHKNWGNDWAETQKGCLQVKLSMSML